MKLALLTLFFCAAGAAQSVSYDRIVNARREPQNWLTYWGDYSAVRYRDLKQINTSNVKDLRVDWIFQTPQPGAFETVPLVVDGVMYFTTTNGYVYALDAMSGRQLWMYQYPLKDPGGPNRGLAILDGRLFMATPNAHLIALDVRNGRLLWDIVAAPANKGYTATMAPLAIKDKILMGISGGELGIRGFIDAYDPVNGKRLWRFWTVPSKDEPGGDTWEADSWQRGGGATWMTGTYDPALNTIYWGVGNPGPDLYGGARKGDNLYTASLVALNADTGKLKWYFQFSPHDTHDWDAAETPMLLDLNWKGQPRKVVIQANRNAFFYVLDRVTGEFLLGKSFARQTWATGLDAKGRPIPIGDAEPSPEGTKVCPGLAGGANWMAPSYNPETGLFYVPYIEGCDTYFSSPPVYVQGKAFWGSVFRAQESERAAGRLKAIDPFTGEARWTFPMYHQTWSGTLATSGGLVFAGDEDGYLMALDARSGKIVWKLNTGNRLVTGPITYMVNGRQYIAMPSGAAVIAFGLPR